MPFRHTSDDAYRAAAREIYAEDDSVDIDDFAVISRGEHGAFVAAWVWVPEIVAHAVERRANAKRCPSSFAGMPCKLPEGHDGDHVGTRRQS